MGFMTLNDEYHDNRKAAGAHRLSALDNPGRVGLFDRALWFDGLHRHCLADHAPHIAYAADRGDAVKLHLIDNGRSGLGSMANWYSFIWRPVFGGTPDAQRRRALMLSVAQKLSKTTHRLILSPVPDECGSATLIEETFAASGWIVRREPCDENHVLHLKGRSFAEYWQDRPGQLRSTVKRKGSKGVISLRVEHRFDAQDWADYETIYARSWKPEEGNPEFLRWLAERESEAGRLLIVMSSIDGQAFAEQFWTVENCNAYIHKLSHDERHIQASPGTLLTHALFAHVIDTDQVDLVDFGTGRDAYKRDWMEEMRPRYRLELIWPRSPKAWPYMARSRVAGLAARFGKD